MIYLSLLELSPRSRQAQAEIANPYEMHRTLSKAFSGGSVEGQAAEVGAADTWEAARCLFRVDVSVASPNPRVLIQSRVRPEWDRLTVRPDYLAAAPWVKTWEPTFRAGQTLSFRLRANPTKKEDTRNNGKKNGRRVPSRAAAGRGRPDCLACTQIARLWFRLDARCRNRRRPGTETR
jgi:CRISPR system Cascade subunit CasE